MADHGNYTPDVQEERVSGRRTTFTARYLEMPGCVAMGDTPEEAEDALAVAREPYIAFLRKHELEVPEPQTTETQASIFSSAGGFVASVSRRERQKTARDVSPTLRARPA